MKARYRVGVCWGYFSELVFPTGLLLRICDPDECVRMSSYRVGKRTFSVLSYPIWKVKRKSRFCYFSAI